MRNHVQLAFTAVVHHKLYPREVRRKHMCSTPNPIHTFDATMFSANNCLQQPAGERGRMAIMANRSNLPVIQISTYKNENRPEFIEVSWSVFIGHDNISCCFSERYPHVVVWLFVVGEVAKS